MIKDIPELFGVSEVAEYMGISHQYISQLVSEKKIIPIAHLSCGRIFLKSDIVVFDKTRKRRQ